MRKAVKAVKDGKANTWFNKYIPTKEEDEVPDSKDGVPTGQGSEEGEEPRHHEVDWKDPHWFLQDRKTNIEMIWHP